jgi:4-hydroxy-3-polyprenylbenzoate decarboxylase
MPLPEGMSELMFAGLLGGKRFRYFYNDGFCISADADFVITGEVFPNENKPEGPFGDHLGYYSLKHEFPLMHIRMYTRRKMQYGLLRCWQATTGRYLFWQPDP